MKALFLLLGSIWALSLPAYADEKAIRESLESAFNVKVKEINPAGHFGLYEVYADGHIFYADENAKVVIFGGELIDMEQQKNITAERLNILSAINFKELNLKNAIKQVRGSGKHAIATFEDPNCGFCKRLAVELQNVKDVTIYTFLYPILGGNSMKKIQNIWCAKDQVSAWNNWILKGEEPESADVAKCDLSAITQNRDFGKAHNINGTPTIFFESGARFSGMLTREQIEENLNKSALQ